MICNLFLISELKKTPVIISYIPHSYAFSRRAGQLDVITLAFWRDADVTANTSAFPLASNLCIHLSLEAALRDQSLYS